MAYLTFSKRLPVVLALIGAITACGSDDDSGSSRDAGGDAGGDGPPAAGDASPDPGTDANVGIDAEPGGDGGLPPGATAFVLGQPDATANDGTRLGLSLPNDVIFVGSRLVVADQNNSRVLIWNTIPTQNHQQADIVLGQPDFSTSIPDYGGIGPAGFRGSNGVASDGTRLIVGDRFNYRVLIWNSFPTSNFQPANVVLGQPDFTTNESNTGGISARSMTEPWVWVSGGKLFVSDRNNVRVLIWNTIPTQNHTPADVVLGQPDMASSTVNNGGLGPSSFADPGRGWVDGTRLFVPDLANHRVLIWNTIPTVDNAPADLVLGQPNMTSNAADAGGALGATGMNAPISVYASGSTVAVADYSNNRVLVWTSPVTMNGQPANLVIGQTNFAGNAVNAGGLTASSLNTPNAVAGDGTRLAISDRFNQRVLLYSSVPTVNGAPASLVLGQPDFVSGRLNNAGPVSASTFDGPKGLALLGGRMAVADSNNARVLIWDAPPSSSDALPTLVLGQPDFTSSGQFGGSTSAFSLCGPWHVHSDGTRLAIGEQCGRRIAIWNPLPTADQQPADIAVGQPDLMSSVQNNGGISASSLHNRPQPHLGGGRLYVADPLNHRVLVWNTVPAANGSAANVVLGQPNMTSATANNGGLSAQSLSGPVFVHTDGTRLFVADTNNHRVLIWNAIPATNQAPADLVLGQPDVISGAESPPSARTFRSPSSIHVDADGRLYVVDEGNHRVVYWNAIPTENYAPADGVIGQPDLNSGLANNGGLSAETLQGPGGVLAVGDVIYVADTANNRILVLPRP